LLRLSHQDLIDNPNQKSFYMKKFFICFLILLASQTNLDAQTITRLWETDSVLKVPESVLYDASSKSLFVSNIDGGAGDMDGKGSIGKVGLDGKIISVDWVSGLNAPKGMAIYQSDLYVADVDAVAVIDIKAGKISKRIKVPGAVFLNDLSIDQAGVIYVSDSRSKKIHKIQNDVASLLLDSLQSPNGLIFKSGKLYFLDNGGLYRLDGTNRTLLAKGLESSTDGIEQVQAGEWLITSWIGAMYHVKEDGTVKELLNTKQQKINSADIGYDPVRKIIYVPTFAKNSIVAYQLK
jgi:DNA-binding beta-propeller fold protein YncE